MITIKRYSKTAVTYAGIVFLFFILLSGIANNVDAAKLNASTFSDKPTAKPIVNPKWFKVSFLEINEDIADARTAGKKGILLYFGQKRCPYCKLFLDNNYSQKDIVSYTQKYFDVVAINVRGTKSVVNMAGKSMTEKQFAISEKANLTPTLLFIDVTGKRVLKLIGYQAPKRYRAAMTFVVEGHFKTTTFRKYYKALKTSSKKGLGSAASLLSSQ